MFVSDNKLSTMKKYFMEKMQKVPYEALEAKSIFAITAMHLLEISKVKLTIEPDMRLTEGDLLAFNDVIKALKTGKPIQQILGQTEFYNRTFKVNGHVLIPRPETEELVDWVVKEASDQSKLKVLDIGTGSGCIAISISLSMPASEVSAIDISDEALRVADENNRVLSGGVQFIQKDILKSDLGDDTYDIIISNPPYVLNAEKDKMEKRVLAFEPDIALFVEDLDPLIFYKRIGQLGLKSLHPGGRLYFEINQYLGEETKSMLIELGYKDVELRQDLFNNDRMLRAVR